jgi:hypothetical protein
MRNAMVCLVTLLTLSAALNADVVAREDFDGGALNLISSNVPILDGGGGDFFGIGSRNGWPQSTGVPFSLGDDSVVDYSGGGVYAGDTEGIWGENSDFDNVWFGVSDTREWGTTETTATWTFDITNATQLELAMDFGGISNADFDGYSLDTSVTVTAQIDGGAVQNLFVLTAIDNPGFSTRPMDVGTTSGGGRLLVVSGDNGVTKYLATNGNVATDTYLDKTPPSGAGAGTLDTFVAPIVGTGSQIVITFVADLPYEAMAFDNIVINGQGGGAATGACCRYDANVCSVLTEAACTDLGGTWLGADTTCDDNPCGFTLGACCRMLDCTLETEQECTSTGGEFLGAGTNCDDNPCVSNNCMSIFDAKLESNGTFVVLCDVVLASGFDTISSSGDGNFIIQDQDYAAGITVYGPQQDIDDIITQVLNQAGVVDGAIITIAGTLDEYNGLRELTDVQLISVSDEIFGPVTPVLVDGTAFAPYPNATGEAVESMVVVAECVTFVQSGEFAFGNYDVTDGTGTEFTVRVGQSSNSLIGTAIPTGPVDVSGIFSDYNAYQILLRGTEDIVDPGTCPDVGACCNGTDCTLTLPQDCGGEFFGAGSTCSPNNPCDPFGACCIDGACTYARPADCDAAGGCYLGDWIQCGEFTCPAPVVNGDIAYGLSLDDATSTLQQVRGCTLVGTWGNYEFIQSVEFDSYGGTYHAANGNLLAASFGAPFSIPPQSGEGGLIYNYNTNGSGCAETLYQFNAVDNAASWNDRVGGLSVSPDNNYVAAWGTVRGALYVLTYDAGATVGTGSGADLAGPADDQAWSYTGISNAGGTIGTTWLDADTILIYASGFAGTTNLYSVDFSNGTFSNLQSLALIFAESGQFTDVEYNPQVSPYVFTMAAAYDGDNYSTLAAVDPADWSVVNTVDVSVCLGGAREIALGPDMYLYATQYSNNLPNIQRFDATDPAAWLDNECEVCFDPSDYSAFNGLDVAFGPPAGACCLTGGVCQIMTQSDCVSMGGDYQGDDTTCDPNPCPLPCSTIAEARALPDGTEVQICDVAINNKIDTVNSGNVAAFQVQDEGAEPRGITVFGDEDDIITLLTGLNEWDTVTLRGTIGSFNGLAQLVDPILVGTGSAATPMVELMTPADFADGSAIAELRESRFVTVECVEFTGFTPGDLFGSGNYTATDGMNDFTVRIPTDNIDLVDTAIPEGLVTLFGIVGQFDTSDPYDGGYQLLLTRAAHLDTDPNCGGFEPGDMNCDGVVSPADIDPFVIALVQGQAAYEAQFPNCEYLNADLNNDGLVTSADIDPFVAALTGGK